MDVAAKRTFVVTLGVAGFMLAALSIAWACTPNAHITGVSNQSPLPGETIHVTGAEFYADTPVEMRWGSATGPVLATTTTVADEQRGESVHGDLRGSFAVSVTVPADAVPGRHVLYAMAARANPAAVALNLPGEEPAPVPATQPLDEGSQPSADESATPVDEGAETVTDEPAVTPAPQEPAAVAPAPQEPAAVAPAPQEPAAVAPAPAPAPEPVLEGASAAVAPDRDPVSSDWRLTHRALLHAVPPEATVADGGAFNESSAFADAVAAAEGSAVQPSGAPIHGGPSGVGAGIGLLAIGLVVLFGGFTAATVARRREKVPVTGK